MAERRFRRVSDDRTGPGEPTGPAPAAKHRGSLGAARRTVARRPGPAREFLPQAAPLSELTRPAVDGLLVMLPGVSDDRRA